jgi:6-phosphogluconolactonase (cycloisomerase 2 family)
MLALVVDKVYIYFFDDHNRTMGYILHELAVDIGPPTKLTFSKDGQYLAGVVGESIKVWNLEYEGKNAPLSPVYQDIYDRSHDFFTAATIKGLAYSPDGNFSVESSNDPRNPKMKQIKLIDHSNPDEATNHTIYENGANVYFVTFLSDNIRFVSGDDEGKIKIWSRTSATPAPVQIIETGFDRVAHVAISKDEQILACSGMHTTGVKVWTLEENAYVLQEDMCMDDISLGLGRVVQFSPDSKQILVANVRDQGLQVFRFSSSKGINPVPIYTLPGDFTYAHYSEDGALIYTYEFHFTVKVWDAKTGLQRMNFPEVKNTNWGTLMEGSTKWMMMKRRNGKPKAVWYDSDKLIEEANKEPWMGALTPDEITTYQLETYLEMAGYLDEDGSPEPIIQKGNEAVIFNFAVYFYNKGRQTAISKTKKDYLNKAQTLFTAGAKIAVLHKKETYQSYLSDLMTRMIGL